MENEKESRIASKLGDYVDGKDVVSGAGWEDVSADVETVNLLRLGFGEVAAADEVFSRRLRRELVDESERSKAPRRWSPQAWALVAASIFLLLASGLLIQRGIMGRKTASDGAREMTSAGAPRLETPEDTALEPGATLSEDEASGYRTVALSDRNGGEFRMEPFSGASEVRIERVTVRWRESRMNAVYERYTIERGGE